jgi:hypothetical protein
MILLHEHDQILDESIGRSGQLFPDDEEMRLGAGLKLWYGKGQGWVNYLPALHGKARANAKEAM